MKRTALCIMCAVCLLFTGLPAQAETAELKVSLPDTVKGYTLCEIVIESPAAGEAELKLLDGSKNLWMTRREQVTEGKNVLAWNGLGVNGERMFAGPYRFRVTVRTADGQEYSTVKKFTINGTTPTLVYALPNSETLYLDGGEPWFVEVFVSAESLIAMEVLDSSGQRVYYRDDKITDPDGSIIRWNGAINSYKKIEPGEYTVRMWGKQNPDYLHTFTLKAEAQSPAKRAIEVTGPVIPDRKSVV